MPANFTCQQLLEHHPQVWQGATVMPQLIEPQLQEYYLREYYLTADLLRLACLVLDIAPKADLPWLLIGLTALKNQLLGWQTQLQQLHNKECLDFPVREPSPLIARLTTAPYPVPATLLWAMTLAQQQRWQGSAAITHTQAEMTAFLAQLAESVNLSFAEAEPNLFQQTEAAFLAAFSHSPQPY